MREFCAVNFTVFHIPGYFFCSVIALTAAVCAFILLVNQKKYPLRETMRLLPGAFAGVLIGARLFGVLSGIYRSVGMGRPVTWERIADTGIVFYGGLFGLLFACGLLSKLTGLERHLLDLVAVCVPLFHAVARIGCFLGGCCYGREYRGFLSITYTSPVSGRIVTAQRVPVPLMESVFNLCLFFYLFYLLEKDGWKERRLLKKYLLFYSIGRFFLEFFRGDAVRGVICGISFSQAISVGIWLFLALDWFKGRIFQSGIPELKWGRMRRAGRTGERVRT